MPALQNLTHQPAEALFTSQGSQDLVKLLPIWGSFGSLSDPNIKYKWHFIMSISLQMFFKSSVSKWYETDGNQQNLCFCLQVQKTKQDSIDRCFTGRQVTCSKDCAVDLKERRKLRELRRQVAETCAMGHRVWASFSTRPRKVTSAQKHKKSMFAVESYEFTLSNKNQSVFVFA